MTNDQGRGVGLINILPLKRWGGGLSEGEGLFERGGGGLNRGFMVVSVLLHSQPVYQFAFLNSFHCY